MTSMLPILAALICTPVSAGGSRPEMPELGAKVPGYNFETHDLNFHTGLRVIIQRDTSAPMVSITTVLSAGSASEPDNKVGVAHLAEHLWFESKIADMRIRDVLFQLGSEYNAETDPDVITYTTLGPARSLRSLLALESARLTDPTNEISDAEFEKTKGLMAEEFKYRDFGQWNPARTALMKHLFPEGHPYAKLGKGEDVSGLSLADVKAFTKDRYAPEHTTIVIIGNFDAEDAKTALFRAFEPSLFHEDLTEDDMKDWFKADGTDPDNPDHMLTRPVVPGTEDELLQFLEPRGARLPEKAPALPEPVDAKALIEIEGAVETPTVVVAWSVPASYRDSDSMTTIVAKTLKSSMLRHFRDDVFVEANFAGQPYANCFAQPQAEATMLICAVQATEDSNRSRVATGIVDQVSELWNPELAAQLKQEGQDGMRFAITDVLHSLDVVSDLWAGRGRATARHAHFTGRLSYHGDALSDIVASDPERIGKYAHDHLMRDRAVSVVIEPFADESGKETAAGGYHGAAFHLGESVPAESPEADPEVIEQLFGRPDLSGLKEKTLPNGLRIVAVPHGQSPLVQATLVYGGGKYTGQIGMADIANYLQSRTIWTPEPNRKPIAINAYDIVEQNYDHSLEGLRGPAGNLDALLWLLRDLNEERKGVVENKSVWIRDQKGYTSERWLEVDYWAETRIEWASVAPDHPRSKRLEWDGITTYKEMPASELRAYLDQKYQPANTTLLMVGMLEADEALSIAEEQFGGWTMPAGAKPGTMPGIPAPGKTSSGGLVGLDVADPAAITRLRCVVKPWETAKDTAIINVLSDYLNDSIRDELTKTVPDFPSQVSASADPGGLSWMTIEATSLAADAAKVVQIVNSELDAVGKGDIDIDRMYLHMNRRAKTNGMYFQSIPQLTTGLARLAAAGTDWSWFDELAKGNSEISKSDLQAALEPCLEATTTTIRGPMSIIAPEIESAGLKMEIVDWVALGDADLKAADPKAYKKLLKTRAKEEKEGK